MESLNLDEPQTILVIEDKLSFALDLIRWLEAKGHSVYGYSGVEAVVGSQLTGIKPLTQESPIEVDLTSIKVCFLDHYFEGNDYNGTSLTQVLVPLGVKVCGMSSVDHANHSMLRYGAVCAYRKDNLARMIGL